jgi:hypothetical protein
MYGTIRRGVGVGVRVGVVGEVGGNPLAVDVAVATTSAGPKS